MAEDVARLFEKLGGLGRFVRPGQSVLIKPNFNTADSYPASSDPDFVVALVDAVRAAGASRVAIGESCTYFLKTDRVMEDWGVASLKEARPWLEVINFDNGEWVGKDIPEAKYQGRVSLPACLSEFDRLIYAPCLKTHSLSRYTGALKLTVGLMKPSERIALHLHHLQEKIGEMNGAVRPDLVVMDARRCFISGGPMNGPVREPGLLLAGESRLEIDRLGIELIQAFPGNSLADVEFDEFPQVKSARAVGVR